MSTLVWNKKIYLIVLIVCTNVLVSFSQKTEIQVLSATVKDKVIDGAEVIFQKNGETSLTAITDMKGKVSIPTPFGTDDASVTILIKKDGYSTLITKGPCNGLTYAISPVMTQLDGLRIVLNWGRDPQDIDSHLSYPGNHICFYNKTGAMANLDVDDTDGYGPETITIEKKAQGQKYVYAVHDYSDKDNTGNTNLSNISGAKVFVYIGNTLIKTYPVPINNQPGNLWIVFMIDETGSFVDVNKFSNANSWEAARSALETFRGKNETTGDPIISQENIAQSVVVNRKGEDAYHAGNIEGSVTFYQRAIELDPNNGQAYSNLGLSFQKLNKIAEAIWANRKAIALAHGPNQNVIQASSYYNIAKIYENQSHWEDALQNYTWAKERRQTDTYDSSIARMKQKLGRQ
jgi:uncharacterized protein YfaP (DUF2135 family)